MSSAVPEKNKQVVQRIYEVAINERRPELTAELVSPGYVGPQGERGPGGFNANVQSLLAGFPDIRFRIEDLLAEGDRVMVRWAWTGTHSGTFRGIAPTGRRVSTTGIVLYQLRDGKVVRNWLESDRLGVLQQLGIVPQTLGPAAPGASRSNR
jgi:predicted ester cyclase